jgi:hypothetical protein
MLAVPDIEQYLAENVHPTPLPATRMAQEPPRP